MVGLIWFVQLVHYPLFAQVGRPGFIEYQMLHMRRTAWLVGVIMPVELITGIWLVLGGVDSVPYWLPVAGMVLLGAIWLSTALWQAPLHGVLSKGFEPDVHRRLVISNWFRTTLWTMRGALVLVMLLRL